MADDREAASTRIKVRDAQWAARADQQFYVQSHTVFHSLQSIAASQQRSEANVYAETGLSAGPSVQTLQYFHRIGSLYCDEVHSYYSALEAEPGDDEAEYLRHLRDVHAVFRLAQLLYVPGDGQGLGVVGEELLHWFNAYDVAPTTEQGDAVAQASPPHQHPEYWDYVFRCVLRGFYGTAATVLQSYTASDVPEALQSIAAETAQLLKVLPRSTAHATEASFLAAHRNWHTSVRVFLSSIQRRMDSVQEQLARDHPASAEDQRLELEAQFRCLLELLCGVQDRVLEFSEDWKEALCTWGALVQPSMKRDDLPDVLQTITDQLPVDGTLPVESVLAELVRGNVTQAIKLCIPLDQWLATHLGDFCDKASLLDAGSGEVMDDGAPDAVGLRDSLLFSWAETLVEEERLWRMALSYLAAVPTEAARDKMRAILFDVPLDAPSAGADPESVREEREAHFAKVEEVLSACIEYGMDDEVRIICRRLGHALMEQHAYGLAVAYSVRARDARLVHEVADRILADYFEHGAAHYIQCVDTIPRVLLEDAGSVLPRAPNTDGAVAFQTPSSIFAPETFDPLAFHVKYRDFHRFYAEPRTWRAAAQTLVELVTADSTPESFLAVLLVDALPLLQASRLYFALPETYELLRVVEKITAAAGGPEQEADYYYQWLYRLLHSGQDKRKGGARDKALQQRSLANERMQVVRLSLLQYLSRVIVEPGSEV